MEIGATQDNLDTLHQRINELQHPLQYSQMEKTEVVINDTFSLVYFQRPISLLITETVCSARNLSIAVVQDELRASKTVQEVCTKPHTHAAGYHVSMLDKSSGCSLAA